VERGANERRIKGLANFLVLAGCRFDAGDDDDDEEKVNGGDKVVFVDDQAKAKC
jgi:hypothetical protein